MCANGADVVHLPGTGFIAVRTRGERANGTDIDASAAFVAFQMIAAVGNNFSGSSAITNTESTDAQTLATDANAAVAENAARRIVKDDGRPLFLIHMQFGFHVATLAGTVAEDHILEFAFTAFVANRTIQRVVGQQKLQHSFARTAHHLGIGMNHHAFCYRKSASDLKFRSFFYFHQAHAAGGLERQTVVIAECGNSDAGFFGRVDEKRSRRRLDRLAVNS